MRERYITWFGGLAALLLIACAPLRADAALYPIEQADVHLYLKTSLIPQLGLSLSATPAGIPDPVEQTLHRYTTAMTGDLGIELVNGSYEGFGVGALATGDAPTLTGPGGSVALQGYRVEVATGDPGSLHLIDATGARLLRADHLHVHYDAVAGAIEVKYADLRITAELAAQLGNPDLAEIAIGVLELSGDLGDPVDTGFAVAGGGASCTNPNFTLPVDVALIAISSVQESALVSGQVAITPSAELQNVGQADVRWEPVLDPDHPLLHWALYRLDGDTFEQIGQSAVKHAFFSVNSDCPCPGGQILWAQGCTDIYGVFTNEDRSFLGPRDEITASTAGWVACNSFFDPDCDDDLDIPTPADELERRLHVADTELETPGARYFMEAWYIIQDDIDIYNGIGWREISPTFNGTFWTFPFDTAFTQGPAVDAFVANGTLSPTQSAQRFAGSEGHFELASRVEDLGGGLHRYEYALANFDFDRQMRTFSVPITPGANITQIEFSDATPSTSDDWSAVVSASDVTFTAPVGLGLDWGSMARMAFTADASGAVASTTIEPLEAGGPLNYSLDAATPLPEPGTGIGLIVGAAAIGGLARRRS